MWPFKKKKTDNEIMTQCVRDTTGILENTGKLNKLEGFLPFTKTEEVTEGEYCICKAIIAAALFKNRTK